MKNVIFDIGNVLINFDQIRFCQSIVMDCNATINDIRLDLESERLIQLETGSLSPLDFMQYFKNEYDLGWNEADWTEGYRQAFTVNQQGEMLRQQLIQDGHKICLLSNLSIFSKNAVELYNPNTLKNNHANFYSYELGYHKPAREIYQVVCNQLDVEPSQCIFLDDLKKNIDGAIDAGMQAYQFIPENMNIIKKQILY